MDNRKISTVVFDMGQVLIHWNAPQILANYELPEGAYQLILQELFYSVEWVQLDHGTVTGESAVESVCRRLPQKLHWIVREIVTGWWHRPLVPMEGMAELVREVKSKGYGIYLLSNASLDLRRYFGRIPGSECFDGLMVSAEEQKLKPNPDIFHTLYQRFGLNPARSVFIDDSPANVESAICTGMSGILFRGDVARLRRELRELGVDVALATELSGEMV